MSYMIHDNAGKARDSKGFADDDDADADVAEVISEVLAPVLNPAPGMGAGGGVISPRLREWNPHKTILQVSLEPLEAWACVWSGPGGAIEDIKNEWGLYYIKEGNKLGSISMSTVAESPLVVKAVVVDQEGKHAIRFEYKPMAMVGGGGGGGRWQSATFWLSDLLADDLKGGSYRSLIDGGVVIKDIRRLKEYVQQAAKSCVIGKIPIEKGTSRPGWTPDEHYVAPGGWSSEGAPGFIGQVTRATRWAQRGDEEEYIRIVKDILDKNPAVALVCGYFVAGVLVGQVGAENFILALVGKTSLGKTLAARVAVSMAGDPSTFNTFDSTPGALKHTLQQSNDGCMVIDEVGQSSLKDEQKAQLIYDISQGIPRQRLKKSGGSNDFETGEIRKSHYTVIVTGETSLRPEGAAAGTDVRYTELVFSDARRVWRSISTPAEADSLAAFLGKNHGWIMPMVVKYLQAHMDETKLVYQDILTNLRARMSARDASIPSMRKAKLMALAATGACVLDEVLGTSTISKVLAEIETIHESTPEAACDEERFLSLLTGTPANIDKFNRLDPWLDLNNNPPPLARRPRGAWRTHLGQLEVRVIAEEAGKWAAGAGVDFRRLVEWARREGHLVEYKQGSGVRLTKPLNVGGDGRPACYCFRVPVPEDD